MVPLPFLSDTLDLKESVTAFLSRLSNNQRQDYLYRWLCFLGIRKPFPEIPNPIPINRLPFRSHWPETLSHGLVACSLVAESMLSNEQRLEFDSQHQKERKLLNHNEIPWLTLKQIRIYCPRLDTALSCFSKVHSHVKERKCDNKIRILLRKVEEPKPHTYLYKQKGGLKMFYAYHSVCSTSFSLFSSHKDIDFSP